MHFFKRSIFAVLSLTIILASAASAISADSADSRCDELLTALRDGNFTAATSHFDPRMKAALSADALGQVWLQIVAANGKLQKWEIIQRGKINGVDVRIVELTFEHGQQISTISVRPKNNELAGLYFKPFTGTPASTTVK